MNNNDKIRIKTIKECLKLVDVSAYDIFKDLSDEQMLDYDACLSLGSAVIEKRLKDLIKKIENKRDDVK